MELTFTRDSEQDQTTLPGNVSLHEVPNQFYVRVVSTLTDADNQTFKDEAEVRRRDREEPRGTAYLGDRRTRGLSGPVL